MFKGGLEKPGPKAGKPGTKPGADGSIEFAKFKGVAEKKVEEIKDEITKMLEEGKSAEEIAKWFCEEVDKDKLGKGNAYFDALIELIKPHVLTQSDKATAYIEIISKIYTYFTGKMENKERGQMHWENMQNRFKGAGLPIEMEE